MHHFDCKVFTLTAIFRANWSYFQCELTIWGNVSDSWVKFSITQLNCDKHYEWIQQSSRDQLIQYSVLLFAFSVNAKCTWNGERSTSKLPSLSVSLKSGNVCNCAYPCVIKCSLSKATMTLTLTSLSHCLKKVPLTCITHTRARTSGLS